jgi:hypothetical protein
VRAAPQRAGIQSCGVQREHVAVERLGAFRGRQQSARVNQVASRGLKLGRVVLCAASLCPAITVAGRSASATSSAASQESTPDPVPELGTEIGIVLGRHQLGCAIGGGHRHAGKSLQQQDRAEPVVTVSVGDVDLAQASPRCRHLVAHLARLRGGQRGIHEDSIAPPKDRGST